MTALKNQMITGAAAADLGLGDILQQETQAAIDERRRKMTAGTTGQAAGPANFGMPNMGLAAQTLLGAPRA